MSRLIGALGEWLEARPASFLSSSQLMAQLLGFLQTECESPNPDIAQSAVEARRALFQNISKFVLSPALFAPFVIFHFLLSSEKERES